MCFEGAGFVVKIFSVMVSLLRDVKDGGFPSILCEKEEVYVNLSCDEIYSVPRLWHSSTPFQTRLPSTPPTCILNQRVRDSVNFPFVSYLSVLILTLYTNRVAIWP